MDELEIAGQRYLSTRRAAKDHKYTSDYVGQLIRAGKVVGKKIGRSWYVEERSLNAYLSGESVVSEETLEVKPVERLAVEETAPIVEEVPTSRLDVESRDPDQNVGIEEKEVEENVFEPVVIKNKIPEAHYIPIRTVIPEKEKPTGLRYVVDDEPALPEVKRRTAVTTMPVRTAVPIRNVIEEKEHTETTEEVVEIIPNKKIGVLAVVSLIVIGATTLGATALISSTLNSHIVVEQGQVASVGFAFQ